MIPARMETARAAWRRLAPRERGVIAAGTVLVVAVALYLFVLGPFHRSLVRLRVEVPQERTQLAVMREQAALVERLRRGSSGRSPATKLSALAEQAAEPHGLRGMITRAEAEGGNGLRIALQGAPFNAMVAWLADLQQRSGLRVETAAIESDETAGAVSARLLLRAQSP